jgi:CRISPR-associated exonuclease Cas4
MKLKRVQIRNFRHIDAVDIQIGDILSLIGPNNVGKSSILRAIQYFCEPINQIPEADFNEVKGFPDIEITIEFTDLSPETKARYHTRLLDGDRLIVKKVWRKGSNKPELFSKEMKPTDSNLVSPEENWKTFKEDSTWKERAESAGKEFRLKDQIIEFVKAYLYDYKDEFEWEEGWVPNPAGLQEILIHHMPEVIFVEGVMSAPQEMSAKSGTTISKILSMVIKDALERDEDVKDASDKLKMLLSRFSQKPLEGETRLQCIEELERELSKHMPAGMNDVRFIVDAVEVPLHDIIQRAANIIVDDGARTPIENKGHGMQRAAIFSLLRTYSALKRRSTAIKEEATDEKDAFKIPYLFMMEEPELFLHPQAQRMMASSFEDLMADGNQVIFSTHSPSLIDLSQSERVCVLFKNNENKVAIRQLREQLFEEDQRSRFKLLEYMNPHRSELFFARRVVFVEGESDRIVLEMLGDYLDVRNPDTTIIEAESKDNLPFYIQLAEAFELDYVVMHDEDAREDDVRTPPEEVDGECEECFGRKVDSYHSKKEHPSKNARIKDLIKRGKLITWYPDLNTECSIPKGRNRGMAAQSWCLGVKDEMTKIPPKLEEAIKNVYTLGK